jgi:DNA processing protein
MPSSCRETDSTRDLIAARSLPGVGDVGLARAITEHGAARAVLAQHTVLARTAAYDTADRALAATDAIDARVITRCDSDYPERLLELTDAPSVLFVRGTLAVAESPSVAIVGTRGASSYGLRVARAIATSCAHAGVCVVSGLAQGIDGAAHEAALAAGGRTVAVLGTGLDVYFPRRHRALQDRIGNEGLLLSELAPGATGHAGTFPRRNRIIAALADVTVVVEAGVRSGALITAEYARDLHRDVACVPNAIDVPSAAGSNALLKAYAEPILSPDDVLSMLRLRAEPSPLPLLDGDAASCWDALQQGADDLSSLAARASLSVRAAASALSALEIEGLVVVEATGRVRVAVGVGAARANEAARPSIAASAS